MDSKMHSNRHQITQLWNCRIDVQLWQNYRKTLKSKSTREWKQQQGNGNRIAVREWKQNCNKGMETELQYCFDMLKMEENMRVTEWRSSPRMWSWLDWPPSTKENCVVRLQWPGWGGGGGGRGDEIESGGGEWEENDALRIFVSRRRIWWAQTHFAPETELLLEEIGEARPHSVELADCKG